MTSIVVGYVAKAEGQAALRRASMEAQLRGASWWSSTHTAVGGTSTERRRPAVSRS
jgi:hypothetical protein